MRVIATLHRAGESWGSNPGPSDLFVSVVASPENACVEGKSPQWW